MFFVTLTIFFFLLYFPDAYSKVVIQCSLFTLGYYIYTESSGRQTNDTARIYSDVITLQPAGLCVRFWYNMYGSDSGTLNLYAKQDGKCILSIYVKVNVISLKL